MPEAPHERRHLAWTLVCEALNIFGITYTGSNGGVKAQIMRYADGAYYSWGFVASNYGLILGTMETDAIVLCLKLSFDYVLLRCSS